MHLEIKLSASGTGTARIDGMPQGNVKGLEISAAVGRPVSVIVEYGLEISAAVGRPDSVIVEYVGCSVEVDLDGADVRGGGGK